MTDEPFIEAECCQFTKNGQAACGDNVQIMKRDDGSRLLAAVCDGLGSGVKANVMANMTGVMSLRFLESGMVDIREGMEIIMDSLPMCSVRKISYSTFSLLDWRLGELGRIIEMGNPAYIHLRGTEEVQCVCERKIVSRHWPDREVREADIDVRTGDRIILCSDGVTQAGLGSGGDLAFGWRRRGVLACAQDAIRANPDVSAKELARVIAERARDIVPGGCMDDITCFVCYLRRPRLMRVLSGPPFYRERDAEFASLARALGEDHTLVCGGTTANILERELGRRIEISMDDIRKAGKMPPAGTLRGVAKVTEGVLTLTRVTEELDDGHSAEGQPGPVKLILDMFDAHDAVEFLIGTMVNEMHQEPSMPQDLDIRRTAIRRLANILRRQYRKRVSVKFF